MQRALPLLCLVAAMFLWASSFVALKLAFRGYGPTAVIFGRMAVASVLFLPWALRFRGLRLERRDVALALLMGLCEPCLYFLFEARALQYTSASQAGIITSLLPVMVAVGAAWWLREKVTPRLCAGLALAVAGAVWLSCAAEVNSQAPNPLLGNFYEFLAMVCATGYTLILKRLSERISPLLLTGFQAALGALFYLPFVLVLGVRATPGVGLLPTAAVLYLGSAVTLGAYGLYNFGVSRVPATQASAAVNLIPVFAVLLAGLVLHETLSTPQWLACVLVLAGVFLSQYPGRATPAASGVGT